MVIDKTQSRRIYRYNCTGYIGIVRTTAFKSIELVNVLVVNDDAFHAPGDVHIIADCIQGLKIWLGEVNIKVNLGRCNLVCIFFAAEKKSHDDKQSSCANASFD